ncbi:GNAT family N-acetyltransferase [Pseudoalteromonas luteoviolacea]|uniref:GNAT family N-acetyltransferase n=1 Tax=Pseudoalteromonas luteoviolacea TaxID=43657 RepID=UPI001B358A40|nr:GNAT family N-acetyltransferase [Pseudoalteromonas luteoviolacea]MBQ4838040.1 GNAT family N-acetyltransferase [Pseudoalteromonas luteoviolacea]
MDKDNFVIRTMHKSEVDIAINWAAQEGWNPGDCDASSYYSADPNGFLIGLLNNQPIAVISAIKYGTTFGFIGFYIVKPEFRGLGYGYQIWQAAMTYLSGCNVGLDGVVTQQDNYRKSGFELAYRNIRYEGVLETSHYMCQSQPDSGTICEVDEDLIEDYESQFFPAQRTRFNHQWRAQANACALNLKKGDKICGYGVIRACQTGYKIGPLYADCAQNAKALVLALVSEVEKSIAGPVTVFIDMPEQNSAAMAVAESLGMSVAFETARMYTGKFPDLPIGQTFGVASFEIG